MSEDRPPPPIDRPVVLFNEKRALQIGVATRREVARDFGPGGAYPSAACASHAFPVAWAT